MRSFLIVPNTVLEKLLTKEILVIDKVNNTIDTLFLYGSVKSFHHAVDSGTPRVTEFMTDGLCFQISMECTKELTPIVCLNCMNRIRISLLENMERFNGMKSRKRWYEVTPPTSSDDINDTHKSVGSAIKIHRNPIHLTVSGGNTFGSIFPSKQGWFSSSCGSSGHRCRDSISRNDLSNFGCSIGRNTQRLCVCVKEWLKLFFPDVSIGVSERSNEGEKPIINGHTPRMVWSSTGWNKRDEASVHPFSPPENGRSRNTVGMGC